MLKRLRSERPVLLSWLFFVWPHCWDVQSCSSLSPRRCSCWVRGGSEEWKRGMLRSNMKHLPFRHAWQGERLCPQWSETATGIRDARSFFYAFINLIHGFKIASVVFHGDLLTRQTHRNMCTLYTHAQMTQSVILSARCAETNKRLLYGAAV